jgi:hypothetical protein
VAEKSPKPRNYSANQQKIIRRYYENLPDLLRQRLAEMVGDLYLADGRKKARLWNQAGEMLAKLGLHQNRIDYLKKEANPTLLAEVVKELEGQK